MPRQSTKSKEQKEQKKPRGKRSPSKKQLESFWDKYWEVIIAAIAGLIVGAFIVPKFFR